MIFKDGWKITDTCFVAMTVIAVILNFVYLSKNIQIETLKKEAVILGFAEHNQTNGVWQWKGIK